ncbi:hypothetical protein BC628DRAFT_1417659 [Trametes gibbosa]|nr:hypothetical protein BC628DRAFT_1417659 [Trametes gibbosa]
MLHKGYEVWVSDAESRRIPEYKMEMEGTNGRTVACYIPSESGKVSPRAILRIYAPRREGSRPKQVKKLKSLPPQRFVINWKDHNGENHTSFKCYLDGKAAGATASRPNSCGSRIGARLTSDSYSSYQFADLRTTDDETALWAADATSLEKVGTIEVDVVRIHAQYIPVPFQPCKFDDVGAVHERSKKLGAHCATLGARVKSRQASMCTSRPLYPHEGTYATFVFRYRPSALLQAQGIMPPPEPAFGEGLEDDKGKARAGPHAHNAPHAPSPPLKRARKSRGDKKAKPEPEKDATTDLGAARRRRPDPHRPSQEVIELSDSDDDRKPVIRTRAKPEGNTRLPDPDDVIDLTLDG